MAASIAMTANYVHTYNKAKESVDMFENDTTSAFISKRSENKNAFRLESFPRDFEQFEGKKVYWSKKWADGTEVDEDGTPFVVIGDEDLECHYGPKCVKKNTNNDNQDTDHSYGNKKRRKIIQNTKKKGCPASIKIKVVVKFPQYKIDGNVSEWKRKQVSKELKSVLGGGRVEKEARFYLFFPEVNEHQYHLTGPFAGYTQPTSEKIRRKISELAMLGVRKISDVKLFLESYVTKELFPGLSVPRNNRRYFPIDKDIRNQIYTTLRRSRFSAGDQQNLQCMIDAMKTQRPTDNFFIRTTSDQDESEVDDSADEVHHIPRFLFVHQTEWQKRLLSLYGQELCLLDATYSTSKYDLPLFFICVQTNVGFSICGTFITANESKDNIAEALTVVKGWNEDWKPSNFLTDFDEREISAVEQIFRDCSVYLCLFHREQAWDRWLKETKNGLSNQKNEIIAMLRKIANSSTPEDYALHLEELHASEHWNNSIKLQSWLGKTWIPNHRRWVYAFRKQLVNVRLNTTNGLERKHQDLKKNYLSHYGDGTLSTLVSVLLNRFLKESYDKYITYNVKSLDICRSYNETIPDFLRNRPKMLVEHCMSRLPPNSTTIPIENITSVDNSDRNYRVKSVDSDITYLVCLDNNGPACQCMDWGKSHLPCKHMLAVFTTIPDWTWDSLPSHFRDCPHFNIDPVVSDISLVSSTRQPTDSGTEEMETIFEAEDITIHNVEEQGNSQDVSQVGRLITVCSHLLKDIQNNIYRINNEDSFNSIITDLKALHSKTCQMIPTEDDLPLNSSKTVLSSSTTKSREKLPLRKNRRNRRNVKGLTKKRDQNELIVDGTYEMTSDICNPSPGTDDPTPGTDDGTDDPTADTVYSASNVFEPEQTKGKGNKRKGCLRDDSTSSKRKRPQNKKVWMADPIEQVQQFENSVADENISVDVIGYRINQQSFTDLESMLPDEVMNAFISLKCKECKDKRVHFIACELMTSIFTSTIDQNDPFPVHTFLSEIEIEEYDIIIGTLLEGGSHWTLMVIFPLRHELVYLNPLGEIPETKDRYLQKWLLFLQERFNRGFGDPPHVNWSMVSRRHGKQRDSNSCGVFVLRFADLILNGKEDNLMFDSTKKNIQVLRLEMGQYLVESSDNMQEVSVTQEIAESSFEEEVEKEQESVIAPEDEDDDDEITDLLKDTCLECYNRFKDNLYSIINCKDKECVQPNHQRHHLFLENPLKYYNQERSKHCFGSDIMENKTIGCLSQLLTKEMITMGCDPKKPYSTRYQRLRGTNNEKLDQIFRIYKMLVTNYQYGVLLKELVVMIHMSESNMNYEHVNSLCKKTEVDMNELMRKSRLAKRK